jgi:ATP-binding cassette subfamily B protein
MLQSSPPEAAVGLLEKLGFASETVLLAAPTDLSCAGQYEEDWLVVTQQHLFVLALGGAPYALLTLPLGKITTFRTHGTVGSGFLQALVEDVWVDVVRYSNGLSYRFVKIAGRLNDFLGGEPLVVRPEDDVDERRCPNCGLALNFVGDVCPRCINRSAVFNRVWSLLRPYRAATVILFLLTFIGVAAELAPPKLQQYLVDHVLQVDNPNSGQAELLAALLVIVGSLAATRLVLAVVNAAKGVLANQVGTAMTSDLRGRMVDKLQQLAVDFYDRQPVGVLMSRVAHDTEALYGFIHQFTSGFLLQILQLVGVGIMLFTLNAKLALWTLIPMPFVLYGSWFFWCFVYPKYYRYWDSTSKQAGALAGMLSGIRVVKAFAQEQREYARFQRASDSLRRSRVGVEIASSTFSAIMQLVFSLGGLIVWFIGGRDVLDSHMTLGALMAFLAYLAMFYAPLATLAQLTTWLTSFLTASQRVFELLDTPNRVRDPEKPRKLPHMRGLIRFENVTFGYDRHNPVLKGFNLGIRPGETLGVVGRSGSGKTTLVNLISRFYDVDAGRVTIDGRDVRELDPADLRRQIGVVLQEPFLFRGTVWENLVYGNPDAAPERALTAARGANAHDFILRLPLAYDTHLGERGAGLSGGERQRLSIARALLYDPQILILDEATSNVDTESEKAIQDALSVLTQGRTTLAIAHRLSTLCNADRIIVMDQGKLIEEGTHAELMAQDGMYAKLIRIQTQASSEASVDSLVLAQQETAACARANEKERPSGNGTAAARWESWEAKGEQNGEPLPEFVVRWLTPSETRLELTEQSTLRVSIGDDVYDGVFAVRALPATCPDRFISLRYTDADLQEHEIAMVHDLNAWPRATRELLDAALARRYLIRPIRAIEGMEAQYGLLNFRVRTDRGPARFTMRTNHSLAQDYGDRGKLLIDVDDNRYLVADIDALPRRQQTLFRRYIYW